MRIQSAGDSPRRLRSSRSVPARLGSSSGRARQERGLSPRVSLFKSLLVLSVMDIPPNSGLQWNYIGKEQKLEVLRGLEYQKTRAPDRGPGRAFCG